MIPADRNMLPGNAQRHKQDMPHICMWSISTRATRAAHMGQVLETLLSASLAQNVINSNLQACMGCSVCHGAVGASSELEQFTLKGVLPGGLTALGKYEPQYTLTTLSSDPMRGLMPSKPMSCNIKTSC